jgi:hypothetical protein
MKVEWKKTQEKIANTAKKSCDRKKEHTNWNLNSAWNKEGLNICSQWFMPIKKNPDFSSELFQNLDEA